MLPGNLRAHCEKLLGSSIRKITPIRGGDINEARLLHTTSGYYFLKINTIPAALQMLQSEAAGLQLIRDTKAIGCPIVIGHGRIDSIAFLLLEYLESGERSTNFWNRFGVELAQLHQQPQATYGLTFDNFIGSLPQANPQLDDWPTFYQQARLQPQLDLAQKEQKLKPQDFHQFDQLFHKLSAILPDEHPSLIHGDLWSGNFLASTQETGLLIDPAVCYAHREMDIAMSKLFGGFSPLFYEAYNEAYPLLPGWMDRIALYQLYYLLVHVNLFGGGYVQSVRQVLDRFV